MQLSSLKGIGKARLESLHAAGIFSLRDLLYAVPYKYKDLSKTASIMEASVGERVSIYLIREGEAKLSRFGKTSRVTCTFSDETGHISACWFNQPWMRENLNNKTRVLLYGLVQMTGSKKQLINPSIESDVRIVPVYRSFDGMPQKTHERIVLESLEEVESICQETLPSTLLERYGLWSCAKAITTLHAPSSMDDLVHAQRRFAFEQMLIYQASIRMVKDTRKQSQSIPFSDSDLDDFWCSLPFAATGAQRRTLREIASDMARNRAMTRMVQGDVGSGKTAVAMGAMLLCACANRQSALMAPTEILARQHYQSMKPYFEERGFGCGLLVGGMPTKERNEALANIASGAWHVVIGTHALISKGVAYQDLGLCITDEQHRFGVAQRTALINKGVTDHTGERNAPHLLVMSATPIPRSLALIMFGDLEISLIDEMPAGRLPVSTRIVAESKRSGMYDFICKELDAGGQAYIVCSLVNEGEDDNQQKSVKAHFEALRMGPLKGYHVGLTFGGQSSDDKNEVLRAFSSGEIQVLVATTVIEVGVNVPNASIMVIEDADRYGLAQLHQLRGRVGRGTAQSWCFLLANPNERLRTLVRTNDGFEVAKTDLELRGPGEILGTQQHGNAMFKGESAAFGNMQLLYEAAQCAEDLQSNPIYQEEWIVVKKLAEHLIDDISDRVSIS